MAEFKQDPLLVTDFEIAQQLKKSGEFRQPEWSEKNNGFIFIRKI